MSLVGRAAAWASVAARSIKESLISPSTRAALVDGPLNDGLFDKAAAAARAAARPISDMRGDADYRRHLVAVLVRRALNVAFTRAKQR